MVGIVGDAVHDAVFYSGEFNDRVVRYSRRTRRTKESLSPELRHDWVHRIRTVFETLGIPPTEAMLARENRLQGLAAQALGSVSGPRA